MKYTFRLVPQAFIHVMFSTYPILKSRQDFRALTEYLLFGTYRDEHTHKLLLTSALIASLVGKEKEYKANNFSAETLFEEYKEKVNQTFAWSKYRPPITHRGQTNVNRRSRVLLVCDWPPEVTNAANKVLHEKGQIYFTVLEQHSPQKEKQLIETLHTEAIEQMAQAKVPVAIDLLALMNSTSHLPFRKLANNINAAIIAADEFIRKAKTQQKKEELTDQLKQLNAFYGNAQPFYRPADGSVRIFSIGEGLCYIDKRLRKILTKGWYEADLTSSQLAIAAKIWGVTKVQKFLQSGGNIWIHLFGLYGIEKNSDIKAIFKTALYSLMYGSGKKRLKEEWKKEADELDIVLDIEIFFASPLIQVLLTARDKQLQLILENKGAYDCFNQWLRLERYHNEYNRIEDNSRSILAAVAQSYELLLLSGVIKDAIDCRKDRNGFTIVLFQHDGFSFIVNRPSPVRIAHIKDLLREAVKKEAAALGIMTSLEIQQN